MGITISDLAKKIGVSTATISRVLNNKPNVSEETRTQVRDAIKKYGYDYKPRSKTAENKNDNSVLIIAGEITNPITVDYIQGIRNVLLPRNMFTLVAISDYQEELEVSHLQFAKDNNFAGIFLLNAVETPRLIDLINNIKAPIILVNRYLKKLDCDLVKIDNYRCGYMATQRLLQMGHRKIAHMAGPIDSITCQDRTRGFVDAMRDANLEISPQAIYFSDRNYYESGKKFGKFIGQMNDAERFTAIYSTTVWMANGIIDGLSPYELSIPSDISMISSDDSERFFHKQTTMTTVGLNPLTLGKAAAELFLERLEKPGGNPKHIVYSPEIIIRNSVKRLNEEKFDDAKMAKEAI